MTDDFDIVIAELNELKEFVGGGDWTPLMSAPADTLVFIRSWPDNSADTLIIRGQPDVSAERTNPAGQPVWRENGTVTAIVRALRDLAEPEAPEAPRSVLPQDSPDRTL